MSFDLSTDNAIILPEKAYTAFYGDEGHYDQVNVVLKDVDDATATSTSITDSLNAKKTRVRVSDASRMLTSITSTVSTLTTFVMAIAGISLLVAAVSIFNVMMMSVTERVREIGIMRSLGRRRAKILKMFVDQAAVFGFVGAMIGAIFSFGIGYMVVVRLLSGASHFFGWGACLSAGAMLGQVVFIVRACTRPACVEPRPDRGP